MFLFPCFIHGDLSRGRSPFGNEYHSLLDNKVLFRAVIECCNNNQYSIFIFPLCHMPRLALSTLRCWISLYVSSFDFSVVHNQKMADGWTIVKIYIVKQIFYGLDIFHISCAQTIFTNLCSRFMRFAKKTNKYISVQK